MALTKLFRSSHTGSMLLTGENGKLVTLLDMLLVNGYNSQTVTITRTGTTATATATSHGFVAEEVIAISGANETEYNGEFRITNVTTNTFDYTVSGSPATPATGTITAKVAPLGWSTAYTSGNDRSYQTPGGANSFYLNVSDGAAGNYQRLRVFSTVTAAGTAASNGTNPVPTDAQISGGLYAIVSSAASTATRGWVAIGTTRGFMISVDANGTSSYGQIIGLTDIGGLEVTANHSIVLGAPTNAYTSAAFTEAVTSSPATTGAYLTNGRSGSSGSTKVNLPSIGTGTTGIGITLNNGAGTSYSPQLARVRIFEGDAGIWAYIPGLWATDRKVSDVSDGDILGGDTGTDYSGMTWEISKRTNTFIVALETSDTIW